MVPKGVKRVVLMFGFAVISWNELTAQSAQRSVLLTACDTLPSGGTRAANCERVAKIDTLNPRALRRLLTDQTIGGQWSKALETSRQLSVVDSSFGDPQRDSILLLAREGRFEALANRFPASIPDPYSARVLGFASEKQGMNDVAANYYSLMVAAWPDESRAQILYGKALANTNRWNEALRVLSRATDTTRSAADIRAQAWFEMGRIALAERRPATALSYLKRARCANFRLGDSTFWIEAYDKARSNTGLDTLIQYRKQSRVNPTLKSKQSETWPCGP